MDDESSVQEGTASDENSENNTDSVESGVSDSGKGGTHVLAVL